MSREQDMVGALRNEVKSDIMFDVVDLCVKHYLETEHELAQSVCSKIILMCNADPYLIYASDDDIRRTSAFIDKIGDYIDDIYDTDRGSQRANTLKEKLNTYRDADPALEGSAVSELLLPQGPEANYVGYSVNQVFPHVTKETMNAARRIDRSRPGVGS